MRVLAVLFGGRLEEEAFLPLAGERSAFSLALERAAAFSGTGKIILLGKEGAAYPLEGRDCTVIRGAWNVSSLLETVSRESEGFDYTYYAWADTPFLDGGLAGKLAERHCRYAADYSYADGWPGGLAPELLGPGTAGVLYKIAGDAGNGQVERDTLFTVLQKDINAFDIETEISHVDLRCHRLNFAADSRRNYALLRRFAEAGLDGEESVCRLIAEKPELLRTLPAFFSIQVSASCPPGTEQTGSCAFCPYREQGQKTQDAAFLAPGRFGEILDKIEAFSGDAVLDLSLWGEISLHPECEQLVAMALDRPALSLIVETTGLFWKAETVDAIAEKAKTAAPRKNGMAPVSWIVSLNEKDLPPAQTGGMAPAGNGAAGSYAAEFALRLTERFSKTGGSTAPVGQVYVQAVRTKGAEDAIEQFYRSWKKTGTGIIIQKYNSFCGTLPDRNAVDLSPVQRRPCWHNMRDVNILLDGSVPFCAGACPGFWNGDTSAVLGNVFTDGLEAVWERGADRYLKHCQKKYEGLCAGCDEYYTYNF